MVDLPVVFLHGIRLSGRCWTEVLDRVGARRPACAVDLPGHGARRGERFHLEGAIDAVRQAIDDMGGHAVVVGHSLGGYVSIATAARHREKVAGLVVTGATCLPGRGLEVPFTLVHRVLSRQQDGGERISGRIFDRVLPGDAAEEIKRGGIATEVIPDVVGEIGGFDILAHLGGYDGPVWLVNGGRDHFRIHERRFLAACSDGRLLVVPAAGHYLPLARPVEFSRLVLDLAAGCRSRTEGPAVR